MKGQINQMSENGTLIRDASDPRFLLMVDISESKKNPGKYFFYASGGSHGKVMFTLELCDLELLISNLTKSLPKGSRKNLAKLLSSS